MEERALGQHPPLQIKEDLQAGEGWWDSRRVIQTVTSKRAALLTPATCIVTTGGRLSTSTGFTNVDSHNTPVR